MTEQTTTDHNVRVGQYMSSSHPVFSVTLERRTLNLMGAASPPVRAEAEVLRYGGKTQIKVQLRPDGANAVTGHPKNDATFEQAMLLVRWPEDQDLGFEQEFSRARTTEARLHRPQGMLVIDVPRAVTHPITARRSGIDCGPIRRSVKIAQRDDAGQLFVMFSQEVAQIIGFDPRTKRAPLLITGGTAGKHRLALIHDKNGSRMRRTGARVRDMVWDDYHKAFVVSVPIQWARTSLNTVLPFAHMALIDPLKQEIRLTKFKTTGFSGALHRGRPYDPEARVPLIKSRTDLGQGPVPCDPDPQWPEVLEHKPSEAAPPSVKFGDIGTFHLDDEVPAQHPDVRAVGIGATVEVMTRLRELRDQLEREVREAGGHFTLGPNGELMIEIQPEVLRI